MDWKLAACGAFFRDEGIIILETRSILYAVRYAESCFPPGHLQILSDNLALVPALCKGRSKNSHASYLCIWLQGRFCRIFQVDTVRIELCDEGSRFFDRDYDLGKSLLHVLAQRSPLIPPTRTCDQDCQSPSLLHLNVGEVDRTSHLRVPAMTVQPDASFY